MSFVEQEGAGASRVFVAKTDDVPDPTPRVPEQERGKPWARSHTRACRLRSTVASHPGEVPSQTTKVTCWASREDST